MTAYLRPTAPIAETVLLPTDPGLAMALATRLMAKPLMANHHHGLWGYSGRTASGTELTVQASGIGAPSAVAIARELHGHGARRLIRIGRCAPLDPALAPASTLIATMALGGDGTSVALGAAQSRPDPGLTNGLSRAAADAITGPVASHDLGAGAAATDRERWRAGGALAVDLETAAVLALAAQLQLPAGTALIVDTADPTAHEVIDAALVALGDVALAALGVAVEAVAD